MKEIVSKEWREHETASDIIAFPKLTNLTLLDYLMNSLVSTKPTSYTPTMRLLVNLEELNIAHCWEMETIVRSADENEKEDQTSMTLFPKLNSFDLDWLPSLETAKVMSVKRCYKLKTLASVIPQIKKLEKDSTAHHEDEDEGISSGSCGCTPYSCGPMTKPTSRRNIVQILPRPVNQEVAPTNLDQDSNDNLERLSVQSCESLEVVFQLKGPKAVESHNFPCLRELKVIRCPDLRTFASKVVNAHSVIKVQTEFGKSEWMGDLNSTIGNIHEKRETQRSAEHIDEEV
ncbi:hypothetical protein Prudu_216S000100 [Prunus dulcis]|uniref:NB-ARC domain-containing disease resistance protein n=1 Tax=Prunus dulcis TaxID=3755 RepID=A0A5H2Y3U7_PRUDU|nr:hypothetical protein Prudu_216S000100 [Prunus dulcis]